LTEAALSRTNVYTLIATALLGVLLYVINGFTKRVPTTTVEVADVAQLEAARTATPGYAQAGIPESGVPRINNPTDLIELLDDIGTDGQRAIADALVWRQQRGFLGPIAELGLSSAEAPRENYASLTDAALENSSIRGEIGATQARASRNVTTDPFYSMELYEQAAHQGSTFAMLRVASLRDTFSDTQLDKFQSDPDYLRKLSELRQSEGPELATEAFAWAFAAVRDGGLPIVDIELLKWLRQLMSNVPLNMDEVACRLSERVFLEVTAERRRRGVTPVTATPPAVFFSVPQMGDQLPCADTLYAWQSTQDLGRCEVLAVENAGGNRVDLYVCAASG
jgi:hypothetical protein